MEPAMPEWRAIFLYFASSSSIRCQEQAHRYSLPEDYEKGVTRCWQSVGFTGHLEAHEVVLTDAKLLNAESRFAIVACMIH